MPRSSGSFTPPSSSWYPATSGSGATFGDWNTLLADLSSALTQSLSQDGQTNPTANLPMSGFKHTGAAAGAATGQYLTYGQVSASLNGLTLTGVLTGTTGTFSANVTLPSINGTSVSGFRNRVINGNFAINQRAVSGTVTLAAGIYGHDRWKAGAAGCTYTFATANNVTTLTISAGSLQQVVEGLNLESGTYALSWSGTATGKIGAGSLSASGVTQAVTGGTDTTIEVSTGTLSKVQLEVGSATTFEQRPNGIELALCQRYCLGIAANAIFAQANPFNATGISIYIPTPVTMRTSPSISGFSGTSSFASDGTGIYTSTSTPIFSVTGSNLVGITQAGYTGLTIGRPGYVANGAAFVLSAEL